MKLLSKRIALTTEQIQHRNSITVFVSLGGLGLSQILKGIIVAAFPSFLFYFFTVQFFGSSIQGFFSDAFKRSRVFNISLCVAILAASTLSLIHGHQGQVADFFKWACIILVALGGNSDVVGRAEIIDIRYLQDRRKIMSWTVFAEAFSWVIVGSLIRYFQFNPLKILLLTIPYALILLLISFFFNIDKTHDKHHFKKIKDELKPAFKSRISAMVLILGGELAYFFFFYNQVNGIEKNTVMLADSYLSWFIGMSIGCVILSKFKKGTDSLFAMLGLLISFFSVFLYAATGMRNITTPGVFAFDVFVFGLAGIGSGVYLPSFYSIVSRGRSIHIQGSLTGMVDSIRVLGDSVTNGLLLLLIASPLFFPIFISGIFFFLSICLLLFYRKNCCF